MNILYDIKLFFLNLLLFVNPSGNNCCNFFPLFIATDKMTATRKFIKFLIAILVFVSFEVFLIETHWEI